jgi:hypothetical protein
MLRTLLKRKSLALLLPLAVVVFVATGCGGNTASVSGEVTFNGEPVGDGFITFLPADGKGPSAAGPIESGRFAVENLTPGTKVVKIEAVKKVPFARTSEEMAKRAAVNKFVGDGSGLIDPADVIPRNAEGNNTKLDVKPGNQTHDFHVKSSGAKKSR